MTIGPFRPSEREFPVSQPVLDRGTLELTMRPRGALGVDWDKRRTLYLTVAINEAEVSQMDHALARKRDEIVADFRERLNALFDLRDEVPAPVAGAIAG